LSVGNDIVDLADPETRQQGLHPRFDERVFGAAERALLDAAAADPRHVLRWALWAAKESAYKAAKRCAPELVFSPKRFAVELAALPAPGRVAVGRVVHRGQALDLEVRVDGSCLHALVRGPRAAGARWLWRAGRAAGDPGAAVRRLAAGAMGSALGLDPAAVQIARRPPVALHRGRVLGVDLSLSHHGRFVGFACAVS